MLLTVIYLLTQLSSLHTRSCYRVLVNVETMLEVNNLEDLITNIETCLCNNKTCLTR